MPSKRTYAFAAILIMLSSLASGSEQGGFFVKPHLDWSNLGNDELVIEGASGKARYDSGFATGLAVGYDYGNGFRSELDFEYRTNEYSSIDLANGSRLTDGDFSSAILYLNGYYFFHQPNRSWFPFIGLGLGWVQEIDFDAGGSATESSFSQSGDWAYQWMAGVEYQLSSAWHLQAKINHINISGLKLKEEGGAGRIQNADYRVWGVGAGLVYRF